MLGAVIPRLAAGLSARGSGYPRTPPNGGGVRCGQPRRNQGRRQECGAHSTVLPTRPNSAERDGRKRGSRKNVAQRKEPMGWEQKRGRSYYYRKVRVGGRVRSEYVGSGMLGQLCAADDANQRRERAARRAADRAARQGEAQIDRQLADAESALAAMTNATLLAAGCHRHRGQWRKRRRHEA